MQQKSQDLLGAGASEGALPDSPWQMTPNTSAFAVARSKVAQPPAMACASSTTIAKNATARVWRMANRYGKMTFHGQRYHMSQLLNQKP